MSNQNSRITVVHQDGMINIDGEDLSYANIRGMYKTGDGHGLQLDDESKRTEAEKLCVSIADSLYALTKLMASEKCG